MRKRLTLGVACLVLVGAAVVIVLQSRGGDAFAGVRPNSPSCTPSEARSWLCPRNKHFDVKAYLGHGDIADCTGFASQADARAVLEADPRDPNRLEEDRNGIACPGLPAPRDLTPLKAAVRLPTCHPGDVRSARCPQSWRSFDPQINVRYQVDEFDCKDYASQADAQAVLRFQPSDPNKLDGEDRKKDGIACPMDRGPKDLKPVALPGP